MTIALVVVVAFLYAEVGLLAYAAADSGTTFGIVEITEPRSALPMFVFGGPFFGGLVLAIWYVNRRSAPPSDAGRG